mgnify:CR=1 FL=1
MDIGTGFPAWASLPAWGVAAAVLATTVRGLPLARYREDAALRRVLLSATLAIMAMRWFNTAALQGVVLHFVGATVATLLFGARIACWIMAAASLAGVLLGAGCAVKLSGLAFMAAFGLLTVLWDMSARRTAGVRHWAWAGVEKDGLYAFVAVVGGGLVAYLASWTGWFVTEGGYYRDWHRDNPPEGLLAGLVPGPLRSLWHYHVESTTFHQGLTSPHDYAANPWTWPFMGRPVSYYYEGAEPGEGICPADAAGACSAAITDIANPFVWWTGLAAVLVCVWLLVRHRDWRAGALLGAYAAGQLVWFLWPERTMFFFYTIAYEPFLVMMIALALSLLLRPGRRPGPRWGSALVLAYVTIAVAVSLFFLPVWIGDVIPYDQWRWRMWFSSWI